MATEGKASASGFSEIQRKTEKKKKTNGDSIIKAETVEYLLLMMWGDGSGRCGRPPPPPPRSMPFPGKEGAGSGTCLSSWLEWACMEERETTENNGNW